MIVANPNFVKKVVFPLEVLPVANMAATAFHLMVSLGLVLLGSLSTWYYSAPPLKLAYRGLGEFSTIASAGFLLPMMGYLVMMGSFDGDALLFAAPLLLYATAFTLAVVWPTLHIPQMRQVMWGTSWK